jgi:hypothetical protein
MPRSRLENRIADDFTARQSIDANLDDRTG